MRLGGVRESEFVCGEEGSQEEAPESRTGKGVGGLAGPGFPHLSQALLLGTRLLFLTYGAEQYSLVCPCLCAVLS